MFEMRDNCPFSKTGLTSKFSVVKFLLEFVLNWLCNLLGGMHNNQIHWPTFKFSEMCVEEKCFFPIQYTRL
jgi:hypothetical protein